VAKQIPFETTLKALGDETSGFSERYLNHFTDLTPANLSALMALWPTLSKKRRHNLLQRLNERYTEDTLLSFDVLAAALLSDPDEVTRLQALRLLAETEDIRLIPTLVKISENDSGDDARRAAIVLLGNYIRLDALEEIPEERVKPAQEALLRIYATASPALQRAALEALGYLHNKEISGFITSALQKRDPDWLTSALTAIARSANAQWAEEVLAHLDNAHPAIRRAAIVASGELGLSAARQPLLDLLEEEDDDEIALAAVWSLSLIGGEGVLEMLEILIDDAEDSEDETLQEFLDDALINLEFTEETAALDLLALDPDDEDDLLKKSRKRH